MEAPSENRSARMRHHHEDDSLVFPRRQTDNLSLDVDSSRHTRVFNEDVMSGSDMDTYNKSSQARARFFVIGGFCCFLFLLATVTIYSSLNEQSNIEMRALDDTEESEVEFLLEDEIIEEASPEEGDNPDGHVTEGGDVIGEFIEEEDVGDGLIIPEIEPIDESELPNEENSVIAEGDDLSEITSEKGSKDLFVMDINGVRFEVGIGSDGDFDLPQGLILNPHVRQHWALIQTTLGIEYYDDEFDSNDDGLIGADGEGKLEPPLPEEDDTDSNEGIVVPPIEAKVRMPEGLLFEAPPVETEHVHGEGCDPVSVDVKDGLQELAAGDKLLPENDEIKEEK